MVALLKMASIVDLLQKGWRFEARAGLKANRMGRVVHPLRNDLPPRSLFDDLPPPEGDVRLPLQLPPTTMSRPGGFVVRNKTNTLTQDGNRENI